MKPKRLLITVEVTEDLWDLIETRREILDRTRSKYAAGIIAQWAAAGAPPIDAIETRIMHPPKKGGTGRHK